MDYHDCEQEYRLTIRSYVSIVASEPPLLAYTYHRLAYTHNWGENQAPSMEHGIKKFPDIFSLVDFKGSVFEMTCKGQIR